MNKIKGFFRDWSIFEKVWLVFVCSLMTVIWFINGDTPFMLVLSLTGSLNLVLGAKGKVAGLYFAIINSALYAYQCLGIPLYGEVMYSTAFRSAPRPSICGIGTQPATARSGSAP